MAQRTSDMPPPMARKYPWDDWFDGSVWELHRGTDFEATAVGFRVTAHSAANTRGLRVSTRVKGDTVYLQARPR